MSQDSSSHFNPVIPTPAALDSAAEEQPVTYEEIRTVISTFVHSRGLSFMAAWKEVKKQCETDFMSNLPTPERVQEVLGAWEPSARPAQDRGKTSRLAQAEHSAKVESAPKSEVTETEEEPLTRDQMVEAINDFAQQHEIKPIVVRVKLAGALKICNLDIHPPTLTELRSVLDAWGQEIKAAQVPKTAEQIAAPEQLVKTSALVTAESSTPIPAIQELEKNDSAIHAEIDKMTAEEPAKLSSGPIILLDVISHYDGTYLAPRAYRSIQQLLEQGFIEDVGDESNNTAQHFLARITAAGREALMTAEPVFDALESVTSAEQPAQEADTDSMPEKPFRDPWAPRTDESDVHYALSYPVGEISNLLSGWNREKLELALRMEITHKNRKTAIVAIERAISALEVAAAKQTEPVVYHVGDYVSWRNARHLTDIGIVRQISEINGLLQVEGWSTAGEGHDLFMLDPETVRHPSDNEYEWIWTYSTRYASDELLFVEWKDHFITFDWNEEINGWRYNWHTAEKDLGLAARVSKRYIDHCLEMGKVQVFKLDDLDDRMQEIIGRAGRARKGKILDLDPDKLPAGEPVAELPVSDPAEVPKPLASVAELNERIEALCHEVATLRQERNSLEAQIANLDQRRARMLRQAARLRQRIAEYAHKAELQINLVTAFGNDYDRLLAENNELRLRAAALTSETNEMRAAALGIPVADLPNQVDESTDEIVPAREGDDQAQSGASLQAEVLLPLPSDAPISSVLA